MGIVRRLRATLGFKRRQIPLVIQRSKAIHNGLADNPALFVAPPVPLQTFWDQIMELDEAQSVVRSGLKMASGPRDAKRDVVWTSLDLVVSYVQSLCDASPALAGTLIPAAQLRIADVGTQHKEVIVVRQLKPGDPVSLQAFVALLTGRRRSKKVSFNWRYRIDGTETFVQVPSTPVGTTEIARLPAATTVAFSVSVSDASGPGDWSQEIRFFVR